MTLVLGATFSCFFLFGLFFFAGPSSSHDAAESRVFVCLSYAHDFR